MRNFIFIIFMLMACSVVSLSQSNVPKSDIENGWKGIKPLKTDKLTVNKLLGNPEIDDNGYYGYVSNDTFIQVNYSTTPCEENRYKRGKYNIPKDIVLDYSVVIKKPLRLSELKFERKKYVKDTSGDVLNIVGYVNSEDGIMIEVNIDEDEVENVRTIYFNRNKNVDQTLVCNK